MVCQHLRTPRYHFRIAPLELLGDASVQLLATALEQAVVGRLLHERVLEGVGCLGRHTTWEDQLRFDQLAKGGNELFFAYASDGGEQLVIELPADYCPDLRDFLHRGKAIKPGQ